MNFVEGFSWLVQDELDRRQSNLLERRYKLSGLSERKDLKDFDWSYNQRLPKREILELAALKFIRTSNPIESTFATVRHRTTRARNCVSRDTFLGLAFKLMEEAEKSWNKIHGADKVAALLQGTVFKNGEAVQDNQPPVDQKLAA